MGNPVGFIIGKKKVQLQGGCDHPSSVPLCFYRRTEPSVRIHILFLIFTRFIIEFYNPSDTHSLLFPKRSNGFLSSLLVTVHKDPNWNVRFIRLSLSSFLLYGVLGGITVDSTYYLIQEYRKPPLLRYIRRLIKRGLPSLVKFIVFWCNHFECHSLQGRAPGPVWSGLLTTSVGHGLTLRDPTLGCIL